MDARDSESAESAEGATEIVEHTSAEIKKVQPMGKDKFVAAVKELSQKAISVRLWFIM